MSATSKRMLFWTPRVLTILFALFISLFALDALSEGTGLIANAIAMTMHLIPTFLVVAFLALAWRWEWVGAVGYAGLGVLYIVEFWGRFPFIVYATIAGPLLVIAALFAMNWRLHGTLREA